MQVVRPPLTFTQSLLSGNSEFVDPFNHTGPAVSVASKSWLILKTGAGRAEKTQTSGWFEGGGWEDFGTFIRSWRCPRIF